MPARPPTRPHRPAGAPSARPGLPETVPTTASDTPSDGPTIDRFERLRESLEGRRGGDALPATMLDGFLCGVLLQPRAVPLSRWWAAALDPDGAHPTGAPPAPGAEGEAVEGMRRVAIDRHAALESAIAQRQWFDPWVMEVDGDGDGSGDEDGEADGEEDEGEDGGEDDEGAAFESMPDTVREAVYPWVAGFAHAMASFQDLLELGDPAAAEPQALLCQFLDADDLEDADALLELIETLEPPTELGDAVEMLVRATLLLADITRPRAVAGAADPKASVRGRPGGPPASRGRPGNGPRNPRGGRRPRG